MLLRGIQSLGELIENTTTLAVAPAAIAVEMTNAALRPMAQAATETVEAVRDALDDQRPK